MLTWLKNKTKIPALNQSLSDPWSYNFSCGLSQSLHLPEAPNYNQKSQLLQMLDPLSAFSDAVLVDFPLSWYSQVHLAVGASPSGNQGGISS